MYLYTVEKFITIIEMEYHHIGMNLSNEEEEFLMKLLRNKEGNYEVKLNKGNFTLGFFSNHYKSNNLNSIFHS